MTKQTRNDGLHDFDAQGTGDLGGIAGTGLGGDDHGLGKVEGNLAGSQGTSRPGDVGAGLEGPLGGAVQSLGGLGGTGAGVSDAEAREKGLVNDLGGFAGTGLGASDAEAAEKGLAKNNGDVPGGRR